MSADPSRHPLRDGLGMAALVAVRVLCCVWPALLAAGALGVLGSGLLNPWLIGTAVLLALGAVARRLSGRRPPSGGEAVTCSGVGFRRASPAQPRLRPR